MRVRRIVMVSLLGCISLFAGCSLRTNKCFDYEQAESFFPQGTIRARLIGALSSSEKETVKGSPYEMLISFAFAEPSCGAVTVSNVQLYEVSSNKLVFNAGDKLEVPVTKGSDGVARAYFSFKGMDLEYVRYKLLLEFHGQVGSRLIEGEVELYFEEDYKEFRSNDLWQKMMSV